MVKTSTDSDFDKWRLGFSRAFDSDPVVRMVLPVEQKGEDIAREAERPRASTLDRVRSIFVQEFNSTLWKPQKGAKKNAFEERESSNELWHIGSAPIEIARGSRV